MALPAKLVAKISFDASTPSMREVEDGEKKGKENNDGNSDHYVDAGQPPNSN